MLGWAKLLAFGVVVACFAVIECLPECRGTCGTENLSRWGSNIRVVENGGRNPAHLFTREVRLDGGSVQVVETEITGSPPADRRLDVLSDLDTWHVTKDRLFPYTAIGRLLFWFPGKSGPVVCTGTLIAENVIVTAAHCLIDKDGKVSENILFEPNLVSGTSRESFDVVGAFAFFGVGETWVDHNERDWAFLYTAKSVGFQYGWLEIDETVSSGNTVSIPGYAFHSKCENGDTLCTGSGPMTLNAKYPNTGEYVINTGPGTSGAPILLKKGPRKYMIVGVHSGFSVGDSGRSVNFGVICQAFFGFAQEAKRKVFHSASHPGINVIKGAICVAHDDCDENSYCSDQFGRCFRCDACYPGDLGTVGGTECPDRCLMMTKPGMDTDQDCVYGYGLETRLINPVCINGLCIDRTTCALSTTQSRYDDIKLPSSTLYVPYRFGDLLTISQLTYETCEENATDVAILYGYRAGVELSKDRNTDTVTILGLGPVQTKPIPRSTIDLLSGTTYGGGATSSSGSGTSTDSSTDSNNTQEEDDSLPVGALALGGTLGALLLGCLILVCCCRRDNETEYARYG